MLERLFISKVRVKVLKQFLLNPGEEYHIRGLVRILSEEINAIRRELQNLEAFGLLKARKHANKIFYKIKPKSPFIYELRSMILKDSEELRLMAKVLSSIKNVDIAIITQAYINKNYESENDIDLLLIGNPDVNKLNEEMKKVEEELERELKMAVLTKEDFEYRKKRREKFILDVLEKDKIILLGSPNNIGF